MQEFEKAQVRIYESYRRSFNLRYNWSKNGVTVFFAMTGTSDGQAIKGFSLLRYQRSENNHKRKKHNS